jgi:hypothetical protein
MRGRAGGGPCVVQVSFGREAETIGRTSHDCRPSRTGIRPASPLRRQAGANRTLALPVALTMLTNACWSVVGTGYGAAAQAPNDSFMTAKIQVNATEIAKNEFSIKQTILRPSLRT